LFSRGVSVELSNELSLSKKSGGDTYIRNGERLRNLGVPIDLLTLAPTPSLCDTARKDWRIPRAMDEFSGFISDGSDGGTTGKPGNVCSCLLDIDNLLCCGMILSRWYIAIAMMQKIIEVMTRLIDERQRSYIFLIAEESRSFWSLHKCP
jgi:hypothetical protein